MMKKITILNNKGGVGKTATVTAVSHILATVYNKKVLVVDMDPQGNTSNLFGKTDFEALIRARLYNEPLAMGMYSVGELLVDSSLNPYQAIRSTAYEGLDLLPSFPILAAIEEQLKADIKQPQQFRLANQLRKIEGDYDYCVIDCAPSLSILNVNALVASDEVYIPTATDDGSLFGIELTISELISEVQKYAQDLRIGGIFFTKHRNYNVSRYARELLGTVYPDYFLQITIRESVAVSESTYNHKPLLAYDPKARKSATQDYLKLTGYIVSPVRKRYLKELEESA